MPELLLSFFLSFNIAKLAKLKGQNVVVWVIINIAAFFICFCAAFFILYMFKMPIQIEAYTLYVRQSLLVNFTLDFFAMGGYLVIRYILEKMPDSKSS